MEFSKVRDPEFACKGVRTTELGKFEKRKDIKYIQIIDFVCVKGRKFRNKHITCNFSKLTINLTEQNWPDIAASTAVGKIRPHISTSKMLHTYQKKVVLHEDEIDF